VILIKRIYSFFTSSLAPIDLLIPFRVFPTCQVVLNSVNPSSLSSHSLHFVLIFACLYIYTFPLTYQFLHTPSCHFFLCPSLLPSPPPPHPSSFLSWLLLHRFICPLFPFLFLSPLLPILSPFLPVVAPVSLVHLPSFPSQFSPPSHPLPIPSCHGSCFTGSSAPLSLPSSPSLSSPPHFFLSWLLFHWFIFHVRRVKLLMFTRLFCLRSVALSSGPRVQQGV